MKQLFRWSLVVLVILLLATNTLLLFLGLCLLSLILMHQYHYWFHIVLRASPTELYYHNNEKNKKILSECKTLKSTFVPSMLWSNRHSQTVGATFIRSSAKIEVDSEDLTMPDGGTIRLDWSRGEHRPNQPYGIIFPGLLGGTMSAEVSGHVRYCQKKGIRTIVFNGRGIKIPLTTPYIGTFSEDIEIAIEHIYVKIKEMYPDEGEPNLVGIGFSMGANVLAKYLGEVGERTRLIGAYTFANPYNLVPCQPFIKQCFWSNLFYNVLYIGTKKQLIEKMTDKERALFHGLVDLDDCLKEEDTMELDKKVIFPHLKIKLFLPLYPHYEHIDHLMEERSCYKVLHNIKIPFISISALDDPVCPKHVIPKILFEGSNPNIIFALTRFGGHVGWLDRPSLNSSTWMERTSVELINSLSKISTMEN